MADITPRSRHVLPVTGTQVAHTLLCRSEPPRAVPVFSL